MTLTKEIVYSDLESNALPSRRNYKLYSLIAIVALSYLITLQLTGGFIASSIYIASKYDNQSKVIECPTECYGYPENAVYNASATEFKFIDVYCNNKSVGYYANTRHMIHPGPVYKKCNCYDNSYKTYDINSYKPNKQYKVCYKKEELPYWFISYITLYSILIIVLFILITYVLVLGCKKLN